METIANNKFKTENRPVQITFLPTSPENLERRGQPVFANPLTVNYETLKRLSESFVSAGKPAIDLKAQDPNLTEEDLLEMANAGRIRNTAANSIRAEFWA